MLELTRNTVRIRLISRKVDGATRTAFKLFNRNRLVKHRLTVLMVDPAIVGAIFR